MKFQKKQKQDRRINAPFISWKVLLILYLIMYFLVIAQYFIIKGLGENKGVMISVIVFYLFFTGLILTILFSVVQRQIYGKPLRMVAKAAKQVAEGDFSIRLSPIRKDGRKDEIEVLIEDFNTMARELQSTEILKNDFISNVSHELKSPLSVIQSYSMALKDPELDALRREEYTSTVIRATQTLSRMISNILKLNKLENQEVRPVKGAYPIGEQLRRCALGYMSQWEEKEIDFTIDVEDIMLCSDADLLEIVWNNLISNAVKFTPKGGRIFLCSRKEKSKLTVKIEDNGPGIEKKQEAHIFDKFYQADESHASEGNGLGLALVKRVLEILDGEIRVESTPGKGTAFYVTLFVESPE